MQLGIPAGIADGSVTLAQVQLAVRRLLRIRLRLGMFDPPMSVPYNAITHSSVASAAHIALAEQGARAGVTLLRNVVPAGGSAPALPLNVAALTGKTIAVIGPNANGKFSCHDVSCHACLVHAARLNGTGTRVTNLQSAKLPHCESICSVVHPAWIILGQ